MFLLVCKNPNTTWVERPKCFELPLSLRLSGEILPSKRDDYGLFLTC